MPRIHKLATALTLAFAGIGAAQAQQFSGVISFGDSLSDAGNIAQSQGLPPGNSFTTNPDPVASQLVAQAFLGSSYNQTNSLAGGTNYAWGGACANAAGPCINPLAPRLGQQIGQYLSPRPMGKADGNALYTVWMGANDIFANLQGGVWTTQPQIQAGSAVVASSVIGNVLALQNAGANYIVVFNLPDLGGTPQFVGLGATASGGASLATVTYNSALSQGLAQTRVGIIPINTFALVNEVIANPGAYGFTNVTGTACSGSSVACGPVGSGLPFTYAAGTNQTYLFADGVHPTGAAHALLAKVVIATIQAPGQISLAGEVPLQVYEEHSGAINKQLFSQRGSDRAVGDTGGYASLRFGNQTYDGTANSPELDSNLATLTAGADFRYSDTYTFGGALTLGRSNGDSAASSLDGTEFLASAYALAQYGNGYFDAIVSGGSNRLDINRKLQLGPTTRVEEGKTDAQHLAFELGGGYDFGTGDLHHGVYANAIWQKVSVNGYSEETNFSSSMRFSDFERKSLSWRIGYQIEGQAGKFQPYARIAYARETKDDISNVIAGSTSMNGTFSLPGVAPSDHWIEADIGVQMNINDTSSAFLGYQGHLNDDALNRNSLTLGYRTSF